MEKNKLIKYTVALSALLILLAIILFDQISFLFLGIGIIVVGLMFLYVINR